MVARKAELDKAWDKRLAVWSKEQEAREALMAQVLNERKGQVEVKLQNVIIDKKHQLERELALAPLHDPAPDGMSRRNFLVNVW